jgi:hypothetical protein
VLWALRVSVLAMSLSALNACVPGTEQPLAEAAVSCQGYTARLALQRQDPPSGDGSPYLVHGARWRAEVQGLPTAPSLRAFGRPVRVHLETFTIRGQRAVRDDTFDSEWRSLGPYVVQEGPLRLSDAFGALEPGDYGDVFLTVMPPNRPVLWTPHIQFSLRFQADVPEVEKAWTTIVAEHQCPTE